MPKKLLPQRVAHQAQGKLGAVERLFRPRFCKRKGLENVDEATAPIALEDGEDEGIADEVRSEAASFLSALTGRDRSAFWSEQLCAQGLSSSRSKKPLEQLQAESSENERRSRKRDRKAIESREMAVKTATEEAKRNRQRGKLFSCNEELWDD
jgi:hypothetical protein